MAISNCKLERTPSRRRQVMDTLEQLGEAFLTHHRAVGSSESTIRHYADSLPLLKRCFRDEEIETDSASLTNHNMNVFAGRLRSTPAKMWRGKTERCIFEVHGALKDVKAFLRWCQEDGLIDPVPKVPVPKLLQVLFPILIEVELDRILSLDASVRKQRTGDPQPCPDSLHAGYWRAPEQSFRTYHGQPQPQEWDAKIKGKGNKERMVYFSESVSDILKRWLIIRGDDTRVVFWLEASGIRCCSGASKLNSTCHS